MNESSRSWYRFRLRSMLIVITLIAIAVGPVLSEVHREQRRLRVVEAIKQAGGGVSFADPVRDARAQQGYWKDWVRIFLGDDYFTVVWSLWVNVEASNSSLVDACDYFPELKRLGISSKNVTSAYGDSLRLLPKLSQLNGLSLENGELDGERLESVSRISSLVELTFKACSIKDDGNTLWTRFPKLKYLIFEKCEISNGILKAIKDVPQLAFVKFVDCQIDDTRLGLLYGSPKKVNVQLKNCGVTEAGVLALRNANPEWEMQCIDASVAKLVDQPNRDSNTFPRLNAISDVFGLRFSGDLITDKTLLALADATNLRELSVTRTVQGSISSKGIEALQGLTFLHSLYLSFSHCTDAEVFAIAKLPNLETLSLWGCPITDASVEELSKLKSLKWLAIGETRISESGLDRLVVALPGCMIHSKNE